MIRRDRASLMLVATALALRIGFFLVVQPWDPSVLQNVILFNDARDYNRLAENLLVNNEYAVEKGATPEALPTPLYPAFVAGFYALCGIRPWIILLAQAVLDTCTCLLILATVRRHAGSSPAFWAALFYALDPIAILYCSHLLSDILFVFMCVAGASLLANAIAVDDPRRPRLRVFASGCLIGVAAMVRPIGMYLPAAVALATFLILRRSPRRAAIHLALFCAAFLLVIFPWLLRNHRTFGSFSLSTSGPYNLLVLNVAPAEAERRREDPGAARARLLGEADEAMRRDGVDPISADPFTKVRYWQRLALKYAREEPVLLAKHYARGVVYMFVNMATGYYANMIHHRPGIQVGSLGNDVAAPSAIGRMMSWAGRKSPTEILLGLLIGIYMLVCYACTAVGLYVSWRARSSRYLLLCFAFGAYFVLVTGTAGQARFKLPAIPFYIAFAGAGAAWMLKQCDHKASAE